MATDSDSRTSGSDVDAQGELESDVDVQEISLSSDSRKPVQIELRTLKTGHDMEEINNERITTTPPNPVNVPCDVIDDDIDDKQMNQPPMGHVHMQKAAKHTIPNPKILQQLDTETQLKALNHIQYRLMHSSLFWIRICILMLSAVLIVLSLSHALGAISTTELILIRKCEPYELQEIWDNSNDINSATGVPGSDTCWKTNTLSVDVDTAYEMNTYRYQFIDFQTDMFAVSQCIIFSILTLCSFCIFIYGVYMLISDVLAIKQQRLYVQSSKFRHLLHIKKVLNSKPSRKSELNQVYNRWCGTDTNGYIARMIAMQLFDVIFQTFALLLYNGYNIWNRGDVYLAHKPPFIYLFVCFLSFNCICIGVLWALYALDRVNGNLFKLLEFCIDEFCDLFYIIFPFVVVFGDTHNNFDDHDSSDTIWIGFGLLNNDDIFAFLYIVFPLLLLCTKTLMMTNSVANQMRNTSYDMWLFVTKIMSSSDQKRVDYLANTLGFAINKISVSSTTPGDLSLPLSPIDDEIYDGKGNLTLDISQKRSGQNISTKNAKCRYSIAGISLLFIAYSITLLVVVIHHITAAETYCNSARNSTEIVTIYPELFFYDYCAYKVYPFSMENEISHSCQCRVFQIDWKEETIPDYLNGSVSEVRVIDGILSRWTMLEKFETKNSIVKHVTTEFELKSSHFVSPHMKLFSWTGIQMPKIDDAMSNWEELLYFAIKHVENCILPRAFKLPKLKIFKMTAETSHNTALDSLCNCTQLEVVEIRFANVSSIPRCMVHLAHLQRLTVQMNHQLTSFPLVASCNRSNEPNANTTHQ
eukprot:727284_1